ncbi:MAG: DUF4351 domain-containing protein [Chloroflexaceae bacterium]|nr:DUF4351 domain-containing protein [Chloroflexaceae bacterium]
MVDHDHLFKELITTFFIEFLELFCPDVLTSMDTTRIEFLDKEALTDIIGGDVYEVDIVAKVAFKGGDAFFIIHVEHQAQAQHHFNHRMFWYFAVMYLKYGIPIYPIALFSDTSASREEPDTFCIAFPDMEVLTFRYRVIQLRRLHWHDYMNILNPIACALMSKMQMAKRDRPKVLMESLRMLAKLGLDAARKRFLSGFINMYLRLTKDEEAAFHEELKQLTPHEREVTMELTTTWKEEGKQEGKQEGILEEAQYLTQRFLTRRIGVLTPDLEERIGTLARHQLEQLFDAAYDFTSVDDLVSWLDSNPPSAQEQNGA